MSPFSMERHALFRFYAELNDFLPPDRRFASFAHDVELPASVKDVIEAIGVPHPEVGLILVNSTPVAFSCVVRGGDRVSVYPGFRTLDLNPLPWLRAPLHNLRFVLDGHLGRLATYLRMLGFDSSYQTNRDDKELARISHDEQRILLTRDVGLLKRSAVIYGYFVRATEPNRQVVEVLKRYDLFAIVLPLPRCLDCNTPLLSVPKQSIVERLEPKTRQYFNEFQLCPACDRIYWAGSHYQRMHKFLERALAEARGDK